MIPRSEGGAQPAPLGSLGTAALPIAWLVSLLALLPLDPGRLPPWALLTALLVRTQLQTGLFILGHDAMHRVLWPGRPQLNDRLGALALLVYAGLPYGRCAAQHRRHHRHTASAQDPDFPLGQRSGWWSWYLRFMGGYLSFSQMTRLVAAWALLAMLRCGLAGSALLSVLIVCILPLLLSSLQLFVVGTYLPHRRQRGAPSPSQPESLNLPEWLSLLACFHFGYHQEHHDHPNLPWYDLPAARKRARRLAVE